MKNSLSDRKERFNILCALLEYLFPEGISPIDIQEHSTGLYYMAKFEYKDYEVSLCPAVTRSGNEVFSTFFNLLINGVGMEVLSNENLTGQEVKEILTNLK